MELGAGFGVQDVKVASDKRGEWHRCGIGLEGHGLSPAKVLRYVA